MFCHPFAQENPTCWSIQHTSTLARWLILTPFTVSVNCWGATWATLQRHIHVWPSRLETLKQMSWLSMELMDNGHVSKKPFSNLFKCSHFFKTCLDVSRFSLFSLDFLDFCLAVLDFPLVVLRTIYCIRFLFFSSVFMSQASSKEYPN